MEGWENADPEFLKAAAAMGIVPDLGKQSGPINHDKDDHDPFATIPAPCADRYFDEPEESEEKDDYRNPVDAVRRLLYVVAGKNHASLRMMAECLVAVVYGMEVRACDGIAGKWKTSKKLIRDLMASMRVGDMMGWLDVVFFGPATVAEKVRVIHPQKPTGNPSDVILHVLYALTLANHPTTRRRAGMVLAIINRTEAKSQAEIGRQQSLTRAAISKEMRDMRHLFLKTLQIYNFGGKASVSEQARERAIRVHKEQKEKAKSWKPSPKLKNLLEAC